MTDDDERSGRSLGDQVSRAVRAYREAQRLPYTEMSERLAALGRPIPVLGLRRIERGQRRVDVDDLAAIAKVLGVPPVLLLFPVGREPTIEVLPSRHIDTMRALNWFVGEAPFTGEETTDPSGKRSLAVDERDMEGWNRGGGIVHMFRQHQRQQAALAQARSNAIMLRRRADRTEVESEKASLLAEATESDRQARTEERDLRALRDAIRRHGAVPPELHPNWAFIDESPDDGSRVVLYPTDTFLGSQGARDAQD